MVIEPERQSTSAPVHVTSDQLVSMHLPRPPIATRPSSSASPLPTSSQSTSAASPYSHLRPSPPAFNSSPDLSGAPSSLPQVASSSPAPTSVQALQCRNNSSETSALPPLEAYPSVTPPAIPVSRSLSVLSQNTPVPSELPAQSSCLASQHSHPPTCDSPPCRLNNRRPARVSSMAQSHDGTLPCTDSLNQAPPFDNTNNGLASASLPTCQEGPESTPEDISTIPDDAVLGYAETDLERQNLLTTPSGLSKEDFIRNITIERGDAHSGRHDLVHAKALFDPGNRAENLMSLDLARRVGLDTFSTQPSTRARMLAIIFPCAHAQQTAHEPGPRPMHLDKSKMGGRLNEVTIRWSGEDEARAQKYIFLRPKYLVSKVRVVKDLACDVVFCLQEIQDKQLDMQITGGLFTEPPDANTDPTVYQNHLDEQSKIRKLKAKITGSKKTTQQSSTTSVQSGSANAHGASGH